MRKTVCKRIRKQAALFMSDSEMNSELQILLNAHKGQTVRFWKGHRRVYKDLKRLYRLRATYPGTRQRIGSHCIPSIRQS